MESLEGTWQFWLLILLLPPYWWPWLIFGLGWIVVYHGFGFARRDRIAECRRNRGLRARHRRR
jgi:hypothetical protein